MVGRQGFNDSITIPITLVRNPSIRLTPEKIFLSARSKDGVKLQLKSEHPFAIKDAVCASDRIMVSVDNTSEACTHYLHIENKTKYEHRPDNEDLRRDVAGAFHAARSAITILTTNLAEPRIIVQAFILDR